MSHLRLCLLMRISVFDLFFYCSFLYFAAEWSNLCSYGQRPVLWCHNIPRHTSQAMLSSCMDRWQSSVCRPWKSLMGSTRHLAIKQYSGQTTAPQNLTGKNFRANKKNLQSRHGQIGTGAVHKGVFNLISVFSESPCL